MTRWVGGPGAQYSLRTPTDHWPTCWRTHSRGSPAEVSSEPQAGLPSLGVVHQEETHRNTIKAIYDKPRLPSGPVAKNLPVSAGDAGLIPLQGRAPGGEDGSPLHRSRRGSPMDRGPWGPQSTGSQRLRPDSAAEHEHGHRPRADVSTVKS